MHTQRERYERAVADTAAERDRLEDRERFRELSDADLRGVCRCSKTMAREQFGWRCECGNFRHDGGGDVFTPIIDCEHKDLVDGCCSHPKNMTPECHVMACPRLHQIFWRDEAKR